MVMSKSTAKKASGSKVEAAKEVWDKGKESVMETAKKTDEAIRSHPYESMGIAFGVGILIGVLIGRR